MSDIDDILDSVQHDNGCSASLGPAYVCKCRMADRVAEAKREIQSLRLRSHMLDEWDHDRRKVLEGACPSDEKHCACVPILRVDLAAKQDGWNRALELLGQCSIERDRWRRILEECKRALARANIDRSHSNWNGDLAGVAVELANTIEEMNAMIDTDREGSAA